MYHVNFELRYDDGKIGRMYHSQNRSEVTDRDYDYILGAYVGNRNDVELHLIHITLMGDIVAHFPSSLSNSSVPVETVDLTEFFRKMDAQDYEEIEINALLDEFLTKAD